MGNTDNANGFYPYRVNGGAGSIPLEPIVLGSNTTLAKGDALILDASGLGAVALSTSAAIVGVAAESNTGSTGVKDTILMYPAHENIIFHGQCSGSAARTLRGTSVDIEGSTGAMEINEDATTEKVVRIIGLHPDSEWGTNARMLFVWSISQFTGQTDTV